MYNIFRAGPALSGPNYKLCLRAASTPVEITGCCSVDCEHFKHTGKLGRNLISTTCRSLIPRPCGEACDDSRKAEGFPEAE